MSDRWRCPFCDHHSTINASHRVANGFRILHGNKYGPQHVWAWATVCQNPECREFTLDVRVSNADPVEDGQDSVVRHHWKLLPAAQMRVFPNYIPAPILADYREACLIRDTSPKASATLARRCLQGMIRDFWGIRKPTLAQEIEAIRTQVDPLTWNAIDSVRRIGNIGAHMEKDINLVIDVDPGEAQLLIELIETLIHDWYIIRHERQQRFTQIVATADAKKSAKAPPVNNGGLLAEDSGG